MEQPAWSAKVWNKTIHGRPPKISLIKHEKATYNLVPEFIDLGSKSQNCCHSDWKRDLFHSEYWQAEISQFSSLTINDKITALVLAITMVPVSILCLSDLHCLSMLLVSCYMHALSAPCLLTLIFIGVIKFLVRFCGVKVLIAILFFVLCEHGKKMIRHNIKSVTE